MRICSPHCGIAPETTSGGETYEREVLTGMARLGINVEVLLGRRKPIPDGVPNFEVRRLPISRGLRWPLAAALLPSCIRRAYRAKQFDVLRAHSLRFIGPAALLARRRYRLDVPVVAHHHHLDPSPLNAVIERRVIAASDRVITGSEFSRRQLAAELAVRTDHVAVVPYGVDEKFRPGPRPADLAARYGVDGAPVALFLGGLKRRKNLFTLLQIWREVVRVVPTARLVIAGGGALLEPLRTRASALGLGAHVVCTGYVPEADKTAHYHLADLFLFPSAMEGFGLAIGEAMSSAVPVVASNRGSIPEIVAAGETGVLCDPDRPETFVQAVVDLLSDAPLRAKLGHAGRERVDRHFRWGRCARDTACVYEDALTEWRRRPDRREPRR